MPRPVIIANRPSRKAMALSLVLCLCVWAFVASSVAVGIYAIQVLRKHGRDLPTIPNLRATNQLASQSSQIFARDGTLLAQIPFSFAGKSGYREIAEAAEIPPLLVQAVLAAEDIRFFSHKGVDSRAVVRAALRNYKAQRVVEGASTITQQLARNLSTEIGQERSVRRKIREALLARRIEKHYSKPEILVAYLNLVFLGNNSYGFKAAARRYFSVSLAKLLPHQAALLAGLIQIPGRGDPTHSPKVAIARRNEILERMADAGFVSEQAATELKAMPLGLNQPLNPYGTISPWIAEEARRWAKTSFPSDFERGGLEIHTSALPARDSVAWSKSQDFLEKTTWATSPTMVPQPIEGQAAPTSPENNPDSKSAKALPPQLGIVFFDYKTGYVETMVGGKDWQRSQFNRATQACRQPGSAFKTLSYGAALESRAITLATPLRDGPISEYDPALRYYWKPSNKGREFRGLAIAYDAFALSLNTPAVEVFERAGGTAVINFAARLGLSTPLENRRPLALGASCVIPSEMALAYATIAREGSRATMTLTREVRIRGRSRARSYAFSDPWIGNSTRLDTIANILPSKSEETVLDKVTAYSLKELLRAVALFGTGRAARSLPWEVGGKTGTTNSNRDAWFVGFNDRLSGAVWIGHDEQALSLGRGNDGSHAALPLWMQTLRSLEGTRPEATLPNPAPASMIEARIDRESGLLAAPGTRGAMPLFFPEDHAPTEFSSKGASVSRDFQRGATAF